MTELWCLVEEVILLPYLNDLAEEEKKALRTIVLKLGQFKLRLDRVDHQPSRLGLQTRSSDWFGTEPINQTKSRPELAKLTVKKIHYV